MFSSKHIHKVSIADISQRPPWRDIPEGGGLNANYTLVDAVARVCNYLGRFGFEYGKKKDFYWLDRDSISVSKGQSLSAVSFVFNNELAE